MSRVAEKGGNGRAQTLDNPRGSSIRVGEPKYKVVSIPGSVQGRDGGINGTAFASTVPSRLEKVLTQAEKGVNGRLSSASADALPGKIGVINLDQFLGKGMETSKQRTRNNTDFCYTQPVESCAYSCDK